MMDALKEYGWILFFPGLGFLFFAALLPGPLLAPWSPPEQKILFFMGITLMLLASPWTGRRLGLFIKKLVEEAEEQA